MFKITGGKGFQITFNNGYTISVQFGLGNYCAHHSNSDDFSALNDIAAHSRSLAEKGSETAEIAIIDPAGELVNVTEWDYSVKGYCSPEEVLKWINYTAFFTSPQRGRWTKADSPWGDERL